MTINDLARLMQGEFIGVKGEFTSVNKRLDVLEADVKFIKDNASELFTKLDEFISLYRDTKQELGLLAKQVNRLEERVVQLEGGK